MPRYSSSSWRSFQPGVTPVGAVARADDKRVQTSANCRILGLDPGSLRTGYGIIDCNQVGESHVASGCINVGGRDFLLRLRLIFDAVAALIETHHPDEIAIERVFVHRNPDSALKLGQARGAAICAAVGLGASPHEYAPRAIKVAVVGYGAAEKPQVAQMVTSLLKLKHKPVADAADALAAALCHAHTRRLAAMMAAAALPSARVAARPSAQAGSRAGVLA